MPLRPGKRQYPGINHQIGHFAIGDPGFKYDLSTEYSKYSPAIYRNYKEYPRKQVILSRKHSQIMKLKILMIILLKMLILSKIILKNSSKLE